MILVEGGSFTMGRVEQDVRFDWNNIPKGVTVSSFYLDETEVRNVDYLEYLFWLERVYGSNYRVTDLTLKYTGMLFLTQMFGETNYHLMNLLLNTIYDTLLTTNILLLVLAGNKLLSTVLGEPIV